MSDTREVRPVEAAARTARRAQTRREGDREVPAGPKARRTRDALLAAAFELFSEQGYAETSVGRITKRAGVSLGTFYQYFRDRADVVGALIVEGLHEQLRTADRAWHVDEGPEPLRRTIERFIAGYLEAGALTRIWEEVCHAEPELAELRRDLGRLLTEPLERELLRGSEQGWLRPFTPREAQLAARALTGMVDRYCYVTYVFDPPDEGAPSVEESAQVLTDLWIAAVGLADTPARPDDGTA